MEIVFNAVGGFIVEVGKNVCKCIYPKIENVVRFSSNIENLREEMEKLTKFRDDIKGKVEGYEKEGYKAKPDVIKWIEDVRKLENDLEIMQESIAAAKKLVYKCCPNCSLRSEVSTQLERNIQVELTRLKKVRENLESNLVVDNYQVKKVEFIPVPSIEGQLAATRKLNKILQLLEDDKVCIIGVLGMGGVGKTTLVKNLNNKLQNIDVSRSKLSFGVVVWVTVPKPTNISKVQAQIANRLNLEVDSEGSEERNAGKIYQRLKEEKSFLLILDDVWDAIDLDHVGVPQPEYPTRSKVIITSRSLGVCKQMKIDTEMKVYTLNEDESWQLFVKNAGDNANLEDIQPFAKEIAKECGGLPLAITVVGKYMRWKTSVELWEDALKSIGLSEPHNKDVNDKVYKVIKLSFDSLESQDIESSSEQRGKLVNKKRGDIQSCFLYCSLYPAAISTNDLIHCWWAEGFLGEHDTYEEAYNRGITMIDSLKDASLLETHEMDSVKMHDVVRDVAIWIDNSFGLTEISHTKVSTSVKRISAVSSKIELPDFCTECPETTTVLLQENHHLKKIPHEFFLSFPALRVLNLSQTGISALPSSINSLCRLRALILQRCRWLKELPPIGDLHNLQLLDCDNTRLHCLPQELDKLTNLRLLNLPIDDLKESIGQGFFLKLPSIEMLIMLPSKMIDIFGIMKNNRKNVLGQALIDEISCLHSLTSLFIRLDSSSNFNRVHAWMSRLKRFHIHVGSPAMHVRLSKARRMISISKCEIFSNGELSGMLEFASDLYLERCSGLRKLIANESFNGLKSLYISFCSCDFGPVEEGSGQFDPLPNLEYLHLKCVFNLMSVSDFSQHVGLRFSKLRQLDIHLCRILTCLFNIGGSFSVPKHLEEITITKCEQLVELVQCSSSQATLVNSEIPRVRKLVLDSLPELGTLGEPYITWEHLEELSLLHCDGIRKLPSSIQTSMNIKVIEGRAEWWSQLDWDDNNSKSNLEHCFMDQS